VWRIESIIKRGDSSFSRNNFRVNVSLVGKRYTRGDRFRPPRWQSHSKTAIGDRRLTRHWGKTDSVLLYYRFLLALPYTPLLPSNGGGGWGGLYLLDRKNDTTQNGTADTNKNQREMGLWGRAGGRDWRGWVGFPLPPPSFSPIPSRPLPNTL
jgi:hypothetical protein